MFLTLRIRKKWVLLLPALCLLLGAALLAPKGTGPAEAAKADSSGGKDFIKWVDFDVCEDALEAALELDLETYEDPARPHLDWADALAWLGVKYGGDFSRYKRKDLNDLAQKVEQGETIESLTADRKSVV